VPTPLQPIDGYNTTNRTPAFIWNNSFDADMTPLTYQIMVDTSLLFDNPVISQSGLPTTGPVNTTYLSTVELDTDRVFYWKVRAYDGVNYSEYCDPENFTVSSYLALSITTSVVDFGQLNVLQTSDTTDGVPAPFAVENAGNIFANITILGTQLFSSGGWPASSYQFKTRVNEANAFNTSLSTMAWTNVTNVSSDYNTVNLAWQDFKDSFYTDINVAVPADEPVSSLNSTVTFEATG
jgi:hypothetical protein